MASAAAAIAYFALLILSFLCARQLVLKRGWRGALWIGFCLSVISAFFAIAPLYLPWVSTDRLLSVAVAQMVMVGAALGIPAGLYRRWQSRTKTRTKTRNAND